MDAEVVWLIIVSIIAIIGVVVVGLRMLGAWLILLHLDDLTTAVHEAKTADELNIAVRKYTKFNAIVHPETATRRPH